ncbi:MAG: hypothetical protein ACU84Q_03635 [Gammaproteobacteria bacterium]
MIGIRPKNFEFGAVCLSALIYSFIANEVGAYDIQGVLPNALGLPELNTVIRPNAGAPPYTGLDDIEDPFTNLRLVLDTGASAVVLFENQTLKLGVPIAEFAGEQIVFDDVGVGGTTSFNVSTPLHLSVGHFATVVPPPYDPATENIAYPRQYSNVNLQLGPAGSGSSFLGPLNLSGIAGMKILRDKITVIQPRFAELFGDTIRAYIYENNIPPLSGPGLLPSNLNIALSLKDFSRFTSIEPDGAPGPSLEMNPFIGPDPLATFEGRVPAPTAPPGVLVELAGRQSIHSFLLDTGNQTSSISSAVAATLGVRFQAGTAGTATPILESFDINDPASPGTPIANQFTAVVGGIAGMETIAGFYLDRLQMKTLAGDSSDEDDPNHLNFIGAPVYVQDIALTDPATQEVFIIAGIIGMNYLMASFEGLLFSTFAAGPFETIVLNFDQNHAHANTLGLFASDFIVTPAVSAKQIPLPTFSLFGIFIVLASRATAALKRSRAR